MSAHPETFTRTRDATPTVSHGSRTIAIEENQVINPSDEETTSDEGEHVGILRLRGDMNSRRRRVIQWDENVIDNEHMNKKKSKVCCIYHKPRPVGESSDSSSSSSSSENDSDSEDSHTGHCSHRHGKKKKKRNPRDVSPNAYERQPVYKDRPKPVNQ
ncbi:phosphatase inhibitor-domain-containing protein [Gilbertella persicaria]|uniref:Type 1 phosphatases regulator n=1 Tax=Rhizopus stolonifer TaxID=4846 RepID=A0A367JCF0_RHIST|nr:phosphatase inhibitor-domain-containing protein [Gilbertella persicaria]KAI8078944.1 phosphatase inhibitor-domain-containing protein [Gilbertella persicaria]RCH87614.1 hypothetical protein CU098_009446 [Rhizopus stolonifer]